MSLAAQVREQLINSFRAELTEHVQTMNDGLLALEQGAVVEEQRRTTLEASSALHTASKGPPVRWASL